LNFKSAYGAAVKESLEGDVYTNLVNGVATINPRTGTQFFNYSEWCNLKINKKRSIKDKYSCFLKKVENLYNVNRDNPTFNIHIDLGDN
jgi:hypothetical protein